MNRYPLVFSFRDLIAGDGYVASVAMDGRVLLVEEDDNDQWMFGVQPGSVAGGDPNRSVAFSNFKTTYLTILYDIAAEAKSFEEFKVRTTEFFNEINAPNLRDWEAALDGVRKSSATLAGLKKVDAAAHPPALVIEEVAPKKIKPNANELGEIAEAA